MISGILDGYLAGPKAKGAFETYQMKDIPGDTSFLEMLDVYKRQVRGISVNALKRNLASRLRIT